MRELSKTNLLHDSDWMPMKIRILIFWYNIEEAKTVNEAVKP